MIFVTFRGRVRSPDLLAQVCQEFFGSIQMRQEPGWIGGECLVDSQDPCEFLIYENWGSIPAWEAWARSPDRNDLLKAVNQYTESGMRVHVYRGL